jgi:hypothetical protein
VPAKIAARSYGSKVPFLKYTLKASRKGIPENQSGIAFENRVLYFWPNSKILSITSQDKQIIRYPVSLQDTMPAVIRIKEKGCIKSGR